MFIFVQFARKLGLTLSECKRSEASVIDLLKPEVMKGGYLIGAESTPESFLARASYA